MAIVSGILSSGCQRSPFPSRRPSLPCTPGAPAETLASFPDVGQTYGQVVLPTYQCAGLSRASPCGHETGPAYKRPRLLGSGFVAPSIATVETDCESSSVLHAYLQWASSSPLTSESCPSAPASRGSGLVTQSTSESASCCSETAYDFPYGKQQCTSIQQQYLNRAAAAGDQLSGTGFHYPARASFCADASTTYFAAPKDASTWRVLDLNTSLHLLLKQQQQQLLLLRQCQQQQQQLRDHCHQQQLRQQNLAWQVTFQALPGPTDATLYGASAAGGVTETRFGPVPIPSLCVPATWQPAPVLLPCTEGQQARQLQLPLLVPTAARDTATREGTCRRFVSPTTPPLDTDGPRECILLLCKALCMAESTTTRLALHIWHRIRGMVRLLISVRQPARSRHTAGATATAVGAERVYCVAALWLASKLEERRREVPAVQTLAAAARTLPSVLVAAELRVLQWCEWSPYAGFVPDDSYLLIDL